MIILANLSLTIATLTSCRAFFKMIIDNYITFIQKKFINIFEKMPTERVRYSNNELNEYFSWDPQFIKVNQYISLIS